MELLNMIKIKLTIIATIFLVTLTLFNCFFGIVDVISFSCITRPQFPQPVFYRKFLPWETNLTGKQALFVTWYQHGMFLADHIMKGKIVMDNSTHVTLSISTNHPAESAMGSHIFYTIEKKDVIGEPIFEI